jgi:phage terminase large subunit
MNPTQDTPQAPRIDPGGSQQIDLTYLPDFAEFALGMPLYGKQREVLTSIDAVGSRTAVRWPNGSGKTSMVSAPTVLWHPVIFPGSMTITTSSVFRQVKEQMWPRIREMASKLSGLVEIDTNQTDFTVSHGDGVTSRAVGFSTDDPGKFEGFHANSLLIVLDEAKTIPDEIFWAVDRCAQGQPTRIVMMSSPGPSRGVFYDAFHRNRNLWACHHASAWDFPHIPEKHIQEMIQKWGEDHPLIRSMIFGEFMDIGGDRLILPLSKVEAAMKSPPVRRGKDRRAFCDFAAGGDENVFFAFEGNRVLAFEAWIEKNTMAAVSRFLMLFRKYGLTPDEVFADGSGLGIPMCDAMGEAGFPVHRVNNGAKAHDDREFANRGSEIWFSGARLIEKMEIEVPDDPKLIEQLTTRRSKCDTKGRLMVERKEDMFKRGLPSPDRADAFLGAAVVSRMGFDSLEVFCRRGWLEVLNQRLLNEESSGHWAGE